MQLTCTDASLTLPVRKDDRMHPYLADLAFDLETLRIKAVATLQALCDRFEPEYTAGLRMLLDAAEYVLRTVIGPLEVEPRRMLGASDALAASCATVQFDEPAELAGQLTELGWPTKVWTLWEDEGADHFASSDRCVIVLQIERALRVTAACPGRRRLRSALIEPGEFLACASGERLFFTEALCRLPHGQRTVDLDLSAVAGFWVRTLIATCDSCETAWRVDPAGDFRQWCAPADAPAWNFFEEASDLAYISRTIACPTATCGGRVAFELP